MRWPLAPATQLATQFMRGGLRISRKQEQGAAGELHPITASMNAQLSWDEFRLVKAIADSRSLAGAAERLRLNHSTVYRRLAAIEKLIGARLFERSRSGYQTTSAGDEMVALASSMAESIVEFERRVAGRDAKPAGLLRVTTVEAIGQHFMPPIMAQFQVQNPGVVIELILSNANLDLSRRDADVAIRVTNDPPESLVGRRICAVRWGVYYRCDLLPALLSDAAVPASFIGHCASLGPAAVRQWVETQIRPDQLAARVNSLHCMLELATQGFGAALLPCFLGDARPGLVRIGRPPSDIDVGLWILTHSDLRRSARVRAFMDFAGAELTRHRRSIEGAENDAQDGLVSFPQPKGSRK
jgi:DNA-binding transcriptional LysR family regulator